MFVFELTRTFFQNTSDEKKLIVHQGKAFFSQETFENRIFSQDKTTRCETSECVRRDETVIKPTIQQHFFSSLYNLSWVVKCLARPSTLVPGELLFCVI